MTQTLTYEIQHRPPRVIIRGRGTVNAAKLVALMDQLSPNVQKLGHFDVLVDFSEVNYTPSLTEIRQFGKLFSATESFTPRKVAFVVSDPRQLKLGRFAALLAGLAHLQLNVFSTNAQALSWISQEGSQPMEKLKLKTLTILTRYQLSSLATIDDRGHPKVRYVVTKADDDMRIFFATPISSRKISQIRQHPEVHLTMGAQNPASDSDWLQIDGRATVSQETDMRQRFWNPSLTAYFKDADDPEYAVVIVEPHIIEYHTMASTAFEVLNLK